MDHIRCLNCGAELHGKYCSNCGQAAATHKFSVGHIFSHDLAHGVFHLDRGFFYTVKEIIRRPGVAIREYIEGKRVNHYNYFAFIILLAAMNHVVMTSLGVTMSDILGVPKEGRDIVEGVMHYTLQYQKLIIFCSIPFAAVCSFIFFRKAPINYAEHLVLNAYLQGALLLIQTIVFIAGILIFYISHNTNVTKIVMFTISPVVVVYSVRFYWQFFYPYYKNKWLLVYRSMQAYALSTFITTVILLFILQLTGVFRIIT